MPFLTHFFGWEGSPTKTGKTQKKGTLLLTSLLEDLDRVLLDVALGFKNGRKKGGQHACLSRVLEDQGVIAQIL